MAGTRVWPAVLATRMVRRGRVIRAVPAAVIPSAPAMAATSRARARDTLPCAPKKVMCTAWAFWLMKITSRMRAPMPAISRIRMLAIRVGRRRARGAGGGLAEPLAEGRNGARMPS